MIILLSPAKNLDFTPAPDKPTPTRPALLKDAGALADVAKKLTRARLKSLMGISDKLADLNYERFQAFTTAARGDTVKQAALAFNGDVYQGLDAASLDADDLAFAQDHVRILSGLYGLLRPLDGMQPYRLEMGSKLKNPRGEDLYDYWGDAIAKEINKAVKGHEDPTIVNLASKEYFSAVRLDALKHPVVTPIFKEEKDGALRQLQFYAKRARGLMARWAAQNRVDRVDGLKDFNAEGYRFRKDGSQGDVWLFARKQPPAKSKAAPKKTKAKAA